MQNKGQFFLIATFIVITLFLSLTLVYNSVTSPVGDQNIYSVAKNLKFEGVNIINNGYYHASTYEQIRDNLRGFTNITSVSSRGYNLAIINVKEDKLTRHAYTYHNGKETEISSNLTLINNDITLDLNSLKFNFTLSKGYNFFVIIINEKQNERYIASE